MTIRKTRNQYPHKVRFSKHVTGATHDEFKVWLRTCKEWLKENVTTKWDWTDDIMSGKVCWYEIIFSFEDIQDATMFRLKF